MPNLINFPLIAHEKTMRRKLWLNVTLALLNTFMNMLVRHMILNTKELYEE
jgi:hypothetical protein